MLDIVERLHRANQYLRQVGLVNDPIEDAIKEIEHLRNALKKSSELVEDHWLDWPKEEISAAILELMRYDKRD